MIGNNDDLCWRVRTRRMILGGPGAGASTARAPRASTARARARDPPAVSRSTMLLAFLLSALSSLHEVDSFSVNPTRYGPAGPGQELQKQQQQQQRHEQPPPERTVVLAYFKPSGVVTTHADDDELGRPNVYREIFSMKGYKSSCDDNNDNKNKNKNDNKNDNKNVLFEQVTNMRTRLHAIGRLDADTTGLLLLTNDGGLVHHVTNRDASTTTTTQKQKQTQSSSTTSADDSSRHSTTTDSATITKTYQAVIMGYHEQESVLLQGMRRDGVDIGAKHGGWTLPVDDLVVLGHHPVTAKSTTVSLTISQGKNRQIRRMFHAVGSGVMKLQRTHIGNLLSLKGLEEGEWRILSDQEVIDGLHWTPRVLTDPTLAAASSNSSNSSNQNRKKRGDTPRPKPRRRRRRS
jgi:pseudouridine synthase